MSKTISKSKLHGLYKKYETPLPVQKAVDQSPPCVPDTLAWCADNDSLIEAFEESKRKRYAEQADDQKKRAGVIRDTEREAERESRPQTQEELDRLDQLRAEYAALAGIGPEILAEKPPRLISPAALLSVYDPKSKNVAVAVPIKVGPNAKKAFHESATAIQRLNADLKKVNGARLPKAETMAGIARAIDAKAEQGRIDFGRASQNVKMNLDGVGPEWRRQRGIEFPQRLISTPGGSAHVDDANALVCWLFRDLLLERASAELDKVLPKDTLTVAARTQRAAALEIAILGQHRICAAALRACEDQGIRVDLPDDVHLNPLAILGIEFVPAKASKDSEMDFD